MASVLNKIDITVHSYLFEVDGAHMGHTNVMLRSNRRPHEHLGDIRGNHVADGYVPETSNVSDVRNRRPVDGLGVRSAKADMKETERSVMSSV